MPFKSQTHTHALLSPLTKCCEIVLCHWQMISNLAGAQGESFAGLRTPEAQIANDTSVTLLCPVTFLILFTGSSR